MRDPDVRLHDAACELLAAARSLHDEAAAVDRSVAVAPAQGCLQAGLRELEVAGDAAEAARAAAAARVPAGERRPG